MHNDIKKYNQDKSVEDQKICDYLAQIISEALPEAENKVWHAHPVWFLDGNPVVGYSKQKAGIKLMFWSGADFDESGLSPGTGKFKDASIFYRDTAEINVDVIKRWLEKSRSIQWDYKNIVKRRGILQKIQLDQE